jgi:ABC-2 type transport system ATP-binding protein
MEPTTGIRAESSQSAPPTESIASAAGASPVVVQVQGLTKRYRTRSSGAVAAVDGLSFSLSSGSITGFLGPNGAGKTTTLRLLLGLARPTAGRALVFGVPYRQLREPTRQVGAVLESGDFDPGRSGRNHLGALALASGVGRNRVEELLALVELEQAANRLVAGYSLGMRQRLGLAAALLGNPKLLVLDEPTNGLDAAGVHWLRGFLRQFAEAGGTVLVCSHLLAEIAQSVDQVLIINHGRLVRTVEMSQIPDGAALERLYFDLTSDAGGDVTGEFTKAGES